MQRRRLTTLPMCAALATLAAGCDQLQPKPTREEVVFDDGYERCNCAAKPG